jgi:hypothetical protein
MEGDSAAVAVPIHARGGDPHMWSIPACPRVLQCTPCARQDDTVSPRTMRLVEWRFGSLAGGSMRVAIRWAGHVPDHASGAWLAN